MEKGSSNQISWVNTCSQGQLTSPKEGPSLNDCTVLVALVLCACDILLDDICLLAEGGRQNGIWGTWNRLTRCPVLKGTENNSITPVQIVHVVSLRTP